MAAILSRPQCVKSSPLPRTSAIWPSLSPCTIINPILLTYCPGQGAVTPGAVVHSAAHRAQLHPASVQLHGAPHHAAGFQWHDRGVGCPQPALCLQVRTGPLTLNVRGPSYLGLTRSISWLLMPWLLTSPGHQHPWYWLCRIGRFLSYLRKDFNHLCHANVAEWHEM